MQNKKYVSELFTRKSVQKITNTLASYRSVTTDLAI